jgi:UDP-N-acetylmuramate: L-alanyl-gamma-D-glutamyl-meso-diaminopimelate ligase
MERIHFIAIGGSVMHNLAIALNNQGFRVSGSDDEIFEPSRSRLAGHGLLPPRDGWFPDQITPDIKYVILGMHARGDNPELLKARELGLEVLSYPEFIYRKSINKTRVVISGSHGKSTITSIILHVMNILHKNFDYLVGAGIEGFDNMVKLSHDAGIIVLEGDEYFSSAMDKTPKFIRYRHNIGLVSGIAWDHINAFPTREIYSQQFEKFITNTPAGGTLIYNIADKTVMGMIGRLGQGINLVPYDELPYVVEKGKYFIRHDAESVPLRIIGRHNMQNLAGAQKVLECLGISYREFLEAIPSFPGAKNRLEVVGSGIDYTIFRDFAHAPSKVRASVTGVKESNPYRKLVVILELHTYSSLNPDFMGEYRDTLQSADKKYIYLNDHAFKIKQMAPVSDVIIREKFNDATIIILRNSVEIKDILENLEFKNLNLLMMSSGDFGGTDINTLSGINYRP